MAPAGHIALCTTNTDIQEDLWSVNHSKLIYALNRVQWLRLSLRQ